MNALVNLNEVKFMSSLEIAQLCEKRHADVIRDIRVMLKQLDDANLLHDIFQEFKDSRNYTSEFLLGKKLCLNLVSGYSTPFRMIVINRWDALENQTPKELSRLEILHMALQAEEEKQALQLEVNDLKPKAQALETIANTDGTYNIRECAKTIGIGERKLINLLLDKKWIYREESGRLQPYSTKREKGIFINRPSPVITNKNTGEEKVHLHMRVTAFGLTQITELVNNWFSKGGLAA